MLVLGGDALAQELVRAVLDETLAPEHHQGHSFVVLIDASDQEWDAALATGLPVLLVSMRPMDPDAVLSAISRGADAVIDATAAHNDLPIAVETVMSGGTHLSGTFTRHLADAVRNAAADDPPIVLTPREVDILVCIDSGQSVKQTARTLGITPKTVENLQSRLYRKLGVRNRSQAVALAHALNLMPHDHVLPTDVPKTPY